MVNWIFLRIINGILKISVIILLASVAISLADNVLSKEINFIEIGDKYYKTDDWKESIWCYEQYINRHPKDKIINRGLLYKIANAYFFKLKIYHKALKFYQETIEKYPEGAKDAEVLNIIKMLSLDVDKSGFNYAEKHDLGFSDDSSYVKEANRLIPTKSEIEYIYSGNGYSSEFKYFKIIQENSKVILQDIHGAKIKNISFDDFAFFWLKLQLTEYINYKEYGLGIRYIYTPKEINILPIISSDGSYAQIRIKTDKIMKELRISNPDITEKGLKEVVEFFNDFYEKLQEK
jgi:tetratricopeptide (TPR) repeat protein